MELRVLPVSLAIFAALATAASAFGEVGDPGGPQADRYIVVYRSSVTAPAAETQSLEQEAGFDSRFEYRSAVKGFAARLSPAQLAEVESDPDVAFVSPDRAVHALAATPLVSGEPLPPTGVRRIEAATNSSVHEASGVNVAVIDTGITLNHPDLNAAAGTNCITPGAAPADDNGHGTHVAGTIAAKNNGAGVVGVAPGTKVYAVKVLDASGSGSWSSVICGIDWVTANAAALNIKVANMSLGGTGGRVATCATTVDALYRAICRSTAAGVSYAVAAGNSGRAFDNSQTPDVPAAYPEVLTVTAVADSDGLPGGVGGAPRCRTSELDDRYASFSNYAATAAGQAHTIAAPGVCITSTWLGGGYSTISGTSMATPHVAGSIALCLNEAGTAGPCAGKTAAQIVQQMRMTAQSKTTASAAFGFSGDPARPIYGRYYGYLDWVGTSAQPTQPSPTPSPSPDPTYEQMTAVPFATAVDGGWLRSGSYTSLAADDDVFYSVTASVGVASWYGRFSGISNALRSLALTYRGKSSTASTQVVSLWNWATNSWVPLDSRSVGATETQVDASASGTLADYVSGTTGSGEVRVRVRCSGGWSFYASGDLLRIAYEQPTA